jgi:PadR family transcriptional regulator, regulatory protein AphA
VTRAELETTLAPVDYLILGLVAWLQPCTSYDLKREVQQTVSRFWTFSHTALYQAPADLVTAGLLTDKQEADGRRRRLYRLTPAGQDALRAWLDETSAHPVELRDLSLLKLFLLGPHTEPQLTHAIAAAQADYHVDRLRESQESLQKYQTGHTYPTRVAALRFGCNWEQMAVEFWTELAAEEAAAAAIHAQALPLPQGTRTGPRHSTR